MLDGGVEWGLEYRECQCQLCKTLCPVCKLRGTVAARVREFGVPLCNLHQLHHVQRVAVVPYELCVCTWADWRLLVGALGNVG